MTMPDLQQYHEKLCLIEYELHIHIFVSSFAVSLKSDLRIFCLEEAIEKRLIFLSQKNDVIVHIFYKIKVLK